MPIFRTIVKDGGQVVLPEELVRHLAIKPGEMVEFFLTLDGHVHFHVINQSWKSLGKNAGPPHRPSLSIREIDDGIADHLAEDDERIMRQSPSSRVAKRSAAE